MHDITRDELSGISNPAPAKEAIQRALNEAYQGGPLSFIAFFNHYASWNGNFAGCMTRLAADVSEAKTLFMSPDAPFLRDRSNLVSSHIFDTVRDEFNDSGSPQRDTHRTLAQALIHGMLQYYNVTDPKDIATTLAPKASIEYALNELNNGFRPQSEFGLFEGIGFHLGSEFFGDLEYTMIDSWLGANVPDLQAYLKKTTVTIDDVTHNCYVWIHIHSGGDEGKGVEADHFDMAITGANKALYFSTMDRAACKERILYGAKKFAEQQTQFFTTVDASPAEVARMQDVSAQYKATKKNSPAQG